jgi:hypothetical protein
MDQIKYNIVTDDGEMSSITVFLPGGGQLVATKDHPNFRAIVTAVQDGHGGIPGVNTLRGLFDMAEGIAQRLDRLSDRVSAGHGRLYFDGDVLAGALADAIIRFHTANVEDWKPLVAFLEKVQQNPNNHSRDQLFRWLSKHAYSITDDGDFIGYKGVGTNGKSQTSGVAWVNGVRCDGYIPNEPGTIIEMPRSMVAFDPAVACSTGLHVGNFRYAKGFAPSLRRIKVNPRDVVSVPTDSNDEKLRVCRYYVLDVVTDEDRSLTYAGDYLTKKVDVADLPAAEEGVKPKSKMRVRAAKPKVNAGQDAPVPEVQLTPETTPGKNPWPEHYERFTKTHFQKYCDRREMMWLAKEWGVTVPSPRTTRQYVEALAAAAKARLAAVKKQAKAKG